MTAAEVEGGEGRQQPEAGAHRAQGPWTAGERADRPFLVRKEK